MLYRDCNGNDLANRFPKNETLNPSLDDETPASETERNIMRRDRSQVSYSVRVKTKQIPFILALELLLLWNSLRT
jgi:hypothetical protein